VTAAHRVHQHVGGLQVHGYVGMPRLPAFEAGHRLVFPARATDLDQRMLRGAAFRGCDARRLAGLLAVMRRPWGVPLPFRFLTRGEFEQRLD
jgi:hypothetical protein